MSLSLNMCVVLGVYTIVTFLQGVQTTLQCRDEDNNPVDWYVMYKLPHMKKSDNKLIKKGLAYSYITSQNMTKGWVLSTRSINDSKSMPSLTLSNLYSSNTKLKEEDLLWIQYNDQPPNGTVTVTLGHTKGVVMAQKDGGFWLVHSVPHYPPPTQYSYPETGIHYGQSFLCISMTAAQMDLVGIQLMYNEPKIYNAGVDPALVEQFPNLVKVIRNGRVQSAPWYNLQKIVSLGGQDFYSFAKAGKFNKELYFDWVSPTLKSTLFVESWQNGEGKLHSSCNNTFMVENIVSVNMKTANLKFKATQDHSKWAAADIPNKDWVCVGDINRMWADGMMEIITIDDEEKQEQPLNLSIADELFNLEPATPEPGPSRLDSLLPSPAPSVHSQDLLTHKETVNK